MKQVLCVDCKKEIEVSEKCNVKTRCFYCKTIHNRKRDKLARVNNPLRIEYEKNWKRNWWNNLTKEQKLDFYKKRKENPAYKEQKSKWDKKYRAVHRKRLNQTYNLKLKNNTLFKTVHNIRNRINMFLKSKESKDISEIYNIIGVNPTDFRNHIEAQFQKGMTWENKGEWHIDHKIPISSAKTKNEIYKLCHYTNLQPLWARDNLIKGKNA